MTEKETPAKVKNFGGKKCSEEFYVSFVNTGSVAISCEACGRTHFYDGYRSGGYDEDELESFRRKQEDDPERYVSRDTDSIGWGCLFGQQVVAECPCGYAAHVESILWDMRDVIMGYFLRRAKKEKNDAVAIARQAEEAAAAINGK